VGGGVVGRDGDVHVDRGRVPVVVPADEQVEEPRQALVSLRAAFEFAGVDDRVDAIERLTGTFELDRPELTLAQVEGAGYGKRYRQKGGDGVGLAGGVLTDADEALPISPTARRAMVMSRGREWVMTVRAWAEREGGA